MSKMSRLSRRSTLNTNCWTILNGFIATYVHHFSPRLGTQERVDHSKLIIIYMYCNVA